jgi:hypothetical protein
MSGLIICRPLTLILPPSGAGHFAQVPIAWGRGCKAWPLFAGFVRPARLGGARATCPHVGGLRDTDVQGQTSGQTLISAADQPALCRPCSGL